VTLFESTVSHSAGLEINEKFQSRLWDKYQNVVAIQQNLRTAFPVSGLAKQNMSPQFLCVKETAENGKRKTKLFLYLTPCSKEVTSSD